MTVKVKVRLLGVFRGVSGETQLSIRLEQATVRNAVQILAESFSEEAKRLLLDPELNDPRPNALILVNGKEVSALKGLETQLEEGDEITLIPVAHGG